MTANKDALDALASDVHNESSAVDSAIVLINGLTSRLTDILASAGSAEDLTAEIQALRDEIQARNVALAQAVAAGTAAENDSSSFPTPEPTPSEPTPETPSSDSSSESTETPSSDISETSDTTVSDSSLSGDEQPVVSAPAEDGSADVDMTPADSSEGTVVPDTGSAVSDESSSSDSPPSE